MNEYGMVTEDAKLWYNPATHMNQSPSPSPPAAPSAALGTLFQLRLRLAPHRLRWGAAWVALCGAIAAGGLSLGREALLSTVIVVFLADALLGSAWLALWEWPTKIAPEPVAEPPELPRERERHGILSYPKAGLVQEFTPAGLVEIRSASSQGLGGKMVSLGELLAASLGALAVAALLSEATLILVAAALFLALGIFLMRFSYARTAWVRAIVEMGVPWTLGYIAVYERWAFPSGVLYRIFTWDMVLPWQRYGWSVWVIGLALAVIYYACLTMRNHRPRVWLLNLAQMVIVAWLVYLNQPLPAGLALLLVLLQLFYQVGLRELESPLWYLRQVQIYLMLLTLTAAWGLWLAG